jgi:predicted PurR-regulated permease PerM
MTTFDRHLRALVWVIVVILLLAGMHATRGVTMPLGVALFIVVLAWPLQRRLETKLPQGASLAITLMVILAVFGLLLAILVFCANMVASGLPGYEQRFSDLLRSIESWARQRNLSMRPDLISPGQIINYLVDILGRFAVGVYGFLGPLVLVIAYIALALLEVPTFRRKLETQGDTIPGARQLLHAGHDVAISIQRFMLTRTLTSGLTGVLVGLYTWALGLDFPLVWAVSSFLLNYIPVLGSVIAVIPPTLLAMIYPQAIWLVPLTFGGLTAIQLSIGNYLDPRLQGRFLFLSPLVLFFSITFWGWIWGIPGALLGVPLTVSIAIVCRHFESSQWIAELLATGEKQQEQEEQPDNRTQV